MNKNPLLQFTLTILW